MNVTIEYKIRVATGQIELSMDELLTHGGAEEAIKNHLESQGIFFKKNPVPGEKNFYITDVRAEPSNE